MRSDQGLAEPRSFVRPEPSQQKVLPLGRIVATPGVLKFVAPERITQCLLAHSNGDWGCLDAHDRAVNDKALQCGFRILSAHRIDPTHQGTEGPGGRFWIVTEWDRSLTTVMLPEEY